MPQRPSDAWGPARLARAALRALAVSALQILVGVLAFAYFLLHALTPA
jgi:hypothetical protein